MEMKHLPSMVVVVGDRWDQGEPVNELSGRILLNLCATRRSFVVKPSPTDDDSRSNRVIVHPRDFPSGTHVLVQQQFALTTR